jgi:glycerate kinase
MNIIVAVDSFKGTLSSLEISHLLKLHFEKQGHHVLPIPISDGGEGFVDAIDYLFNNGLITVDTYGPLQDAIQANYIKYQDIAFIELSSVSGLNKIDKSRLNPLETSTYGLGLLVLDAIDQGAKKIVLGLGGSATNDGGAGMLQALGVKFYHNEELILEPMSGKLLSKITSFDTAALDQKIKGISFELASDVKNLLLGSDGCAHIYAKQKGANQKMRSKLEINMTHFADVVENHYDQTYRFFEGAGAAGGFGFGAMAFLNAKIHSGIDYMIDLLNLDSYIKTSDIVIVGEGKLDKQTSFGKAPYGIAKIAKKYNKKVIGIFAVSEGIREANYLDEVHVIVPKYASVEFSMNEPKKALIKMLNDIEVTI